MPHPKKGDAALRRIKAYIQEKGWTQGRDIDPQTGAVCLAQAVQAVHVLGSSYVVFRRLYTATGASSSLTAWNDRKGRTVEDVYALIDQTIKDN